MEKIIKNILKKIESNGFEAYIVGGYVRDLLLGNISYDVDICTNALPKDLHIIFPNTGNSNNYGGFKLKIKKYNIDITTYREDVKYENRKPIEINYINNLIDDINRRDFTINAICMNYNGDIIDMINGIDDIKSKTIRIIGDANRKLKDDPLRILRAIRFSTILDFDIESTLYKSIKDNYKLVSTLSNERIKSELTKILMSPNYKKGLSILKDTKILKVLGIDYHNIVYINDISGMWAQLEFNKDFSFTKSEKENIIKIKEVLNIGKIDNRILYNYGLYISQIAGNILGYSKKDINNMFDKLNLPNKYELAIKSKEIKEILDVDYKYISKIENKIINLILDGNLKNDYKLLKKYLVNNKEVFKGGQL